jgi:hypothetical protein
MSNSTKCIFLRVKKNTGHKFTKIKEKPTFKIHHYSQLKAAPNGSRTFLQGKDEKY